MLKSAKDMSTVLVLGNGRMGTDISCQCALFGKKVRMFIGVENPPEALEPVLERQKDYLQMLIGKGFITENVAERASKNITFDTDIARICEGVDLVVEAVLETLEAKRAIWSRFAPYLPEDALLASNTATLLLSAFADASGAPERFVGWHFATPSYIQNFVDIMPHEGTDKQWLQILGDFSNDIGLNYGIMNREIGGYITNNMLYSFMDKAFELMLNGYATFKEIDKAWMAVRIVPIGPFGIMDKVGLPNMRNVYAARSKQTEITKKAIAYYDEMIAQGKEGVRNGHGFYEYPNPEFQQPGFVQYAKKLS